MNPRPRVPAAITADIGPRLAGEGVQIVPETMPCGWIHIGTYSRSMAGLSCELWCMIKKVNVSLVYGLFLTIDASVCVCV